MNLIPSTLPSEQVDFAQLFPSAALPGSSPVRTGGIAAPALGFEQVIAALQPAAPAVSQPANQLAALPLTGDVQPPAAAVMEQFAGDVAIVAPIAGEAVDATETQPLTASAIGGKRGTAKADRTRPTGDFGLRSEEDGCAETRKNTELPLCPTFDPMAAGVPVAQAPVAFELGESVDIANDDDLGGTMTFDDRGEAREGEEAVAFSNSTSSGGEAIQPSRLNSTRFEAAAFAAKPGAIAYGEAADAVRTSGSFTPEAQAVQQDEAGSGVSFAEPDSHLPLDPAGAIIRRAADVAMPRPAANAVAANPSHLVDLTPAEGANFQPSFEAGKFSASVAIDAAARSADVTSVVLPATSNEGIRESATPEAAEIPLPSAAPKPLGAPEMNVAAARPETHEENFAGMPNAVETVAREPKNRTAKTSLASVNKHVAKHAEDVGTDVANSSASMSLRTATPTLPHPVPEYTAAAAADGVTATDAAAPQTVALSELSSDAVSEAHRAVEVVLRAVDQVSGREQSSVKLDFAIGDTELSVRVELRADEVATTFTTDSSELRTALAHEWQSLSAATAERPVRLAQPVFTGADSASDSYLNQHSGGQSQRDGARSEQAAQQGWGRFQGGSSGSRSAEQTPAISPLAAFAPAGTALRLNLFA